MSRRAWVVAVAIAVLSVGASRAEDWEIVPSVGLRFGGDVEQIDSGRTLDLEPSPCFGLTLGRVLTPETRLQGTWSHQSASVDDSDVDGTIDYLHFAGVYEGHPDRHASGYVLASAGVTLFDAGGSDTTTHLSFSVGGGGRWDLGRRTRFQLEGRLWGTLTSAGTGVFCSGGCVVAFSGTGVFQFDLSAGLVIAF